VATVEKPRTDKQPVTRLALSKSEAAEAIGCSVDFLEEHIWPELKIVRRGWLVFVAVTELQRWLEREATGRSQPNEQTAGEAETPPAHAENWKPQHGDGNPGARRAGSHGRPITGRSSVRRAGIATPDEDPSQSAHFRGGRRGQTP
jgi:hypothetical protein